MSVCGTTVSSTVISATQYRDFLCTRYNVSPVNIQIHCDRYGTAFGVTHTPSYSIDGLVIERHNEIREKLLYLDRRAFTSESLRAKPLIHQGRTRSEQEMRQGGDNHKDTIGDVVIRGLWDRQFNAIIDVKLGDADANMYTY